MENENTESKTFIILTSVGAGMSILFSLILIFLLNKKKSNYARLMRHIVMSENIFIFAQMMLVTADFHKHTFKVLSSILDHLTFGIAKIDEAYLKFANGSVYYAHEAFSILLNIFICVEIILILKNPIVQVKNRLKFYFSFSTIVAITVFLLACFTIPDTSTPDTYDIIFYAHISIAINLGIYLIFVLFGLISIFYLAYRFCLGKTLLQNLRNIFVVRHCVYVAIYMVCLLPNKINVLKVLLGYKPDFYLKYSILLNLLMGFIMFLIRASETSFYNKIFCRYSMSGGKLTDVSREGDKTRQSESHEDSNFFDRDQPLTAIISRNMNLEFMCCILYGLSEIFMKPERRNKLSDISQNDGITFNIKSSNDKSLLNSKTINTKDFKRGKSHRIRYKKIFKDNIDFEEMEVEVSSFGKKKNRESSESSIMNDTYPNEETGKIKDYHALVIEYCPKIFRELRKLDEISGHDLESSLNPILNLDSINKIKESEGKSGSFFFFSHDNRFLIKTITNNELNTVLGNFMKCYYEHCTNYPESLMAKIYGLYSIVVGDVSKINLILMQNLLCVPSNHIKRIFDLKGSRVERITKKIEKCDKSKTLKDLDYLWMIDIEEDMIDIPKDHCEELISILQTDLKMLREVGVMDYSLLLIILHFPKIDDPDYQNIFNLFGDPRYCRRIFKSKNMKYIYIMGIIDYLQKFNAAKFFENKYKSIVYGNEIKYVSAVDPMIYSERLFNFAKDNIFISQSS